MIVSGVHSREYLRCYSRIQSLNFTFDKRTKHPPLDPANALLSLEYVLITNEIGGLAESTGFDPFIGFLHSLRYGR